jgi:hypothetical protein
MDTTEGDRSGRIHEQESRMVAELNGDKNETVLVRTDSNWRRASELLATADIGSEAAGLGTCVCTTLTPLTAS